jgi:hypothetical protein
LRSGPRGPLFFIVVKEIPSPTKWERVRVRAVDKRTFLKSAAAVVLNAAAAVALNAPVAANVLAADDTPVRPSRRRRDRPTRNGIWIPANIDHTPDEWSRLFDRMVVAGIDGILPQVYDGRYAYFDSPTLPVKADRLKTIAPLAKEAGLEVHAWMQTLPCRIEDIQTKHPEWYTMNAKGERALSLEPAHPEARAFVKGIVAEVAAIPGLAGVHLDAAQYPDAEYGYSEHNRAAFKQAQGIDPVEVADDAHRQTWTQYRLDALTEMVNDHLAPAAHAAERALTASVLPSPTLARERGLQDWPSWKLNAFFPLFSAYGDGAPLAREGREGQGEGETWIRAQTQQAVAAVTVPVCAGLLVAPLGFSDLAKAVRAALEGGASGVSLSALDAMTEEKWMGLQVVIIGQRPD